MSLLRVATAKLFPVGTPVEYGRFRITRTDPEVYVVESMGSARNIRVPRDSNFIDLDTGICH